MNSDSESVEKRPRLRQRFRKLTRAAILEAAEEVFGKEGVHRARMETIAARAGVAVGTLYNHFADRHALLEELVRSRRATLLARLDRALEEGRAQPASRALELFLRALFDHWAEHRDLLSVLLQSERLGKPASSEDHGRPIVQELTRRADRIIRRGISSGQLRSEGAELHGALLVGMARGALVQDLLVDRLRTRTDLADRVLDLFLRGSAR